VATVVEAGVREQTARQGVERCHPQHVVGAAPRPALPAAATATAWHLNLNPNLVPRRRKPMWRGTRGGGGVGVGFGRGVAPLLLRKRAAATRVTWCGVQRVR